MNVGLGIATSSLKDFSKPDGDACNEDGTLKDASEMDWPDSPSGSTNNVKLKRVYDDDPSDGEAGEEEDANSNDMVQNRNKRQRVSIRNASNKK